MNRKEGYYWVRVNESRDWEIAFWWNEHWCFPGFTMQLKKVFAIDERKIERIEPNTDNNEPEAKTRRTTE